mmetsp:Transcript_1832/g.3196  ORF Transcript_1832/g.3196 Transcript_1832/m.3196 type:complete len:416 (-) Transcript_1832:262-1509(-)
MINRPSSSSYPRRDWRGLFSMANNGLSFSSLPSFSSSSSTSSSSSSSSSKSNASSSSSLSSCSSSLSSSTILRLRPTDFPTLNCTPLFCLTSCSSSSSSSSSTSSSNKASSTFTYRGFFVTPPPRRFSEGSKSIMVKSNSSLDPRKRSERSEGSWRTEDVPRNAASDRSHRSSLGLDSGCFLTDLMSFTSQPKSSSPFPSSTSSSRSILDVTGFGPACFVKGRTFFLFLRSQTKPSSSSSTLLCFDAVGFDSACFLTGLDLGSSKSQPKSSPSSSKSFRFATLGFRSASFWIDFESSKSQPKSSSSSSSLLLTAYSCSSPSSFPTTFLSSESMRLVDWSLDSDSARGFLGELRFSLTSHSESTSSSTSSDGSSIVRFATLFHSLRDDLPSALGISDLAIRFSTDFSGFTALDCGS